jgi:hypothetical protein
MLSYWNCITSQITNFHALSCYEYNEKEYCDEPNVDQTAVKRQRTLDQETNDDMTKCQ